MSTQDKVALVVGAQGVIGRNLVDHLDGLGDWKVIGLSRRGQASGRVRHVAVDLLDRAGCRAKLSGLTGVTHVFYAAYQDRPTWAELVPPNLAMLVNVVDALEPVASGLRHISLMQGYKVYGAHLGPFKTPARENDAGLLARASVWAATEERCANQAFNINNGDLFRWSEMWPKIARFFGLEVAPPLQMSLSVVMADKEPLWKDMVARYGLEPHPYKDVSSWAFGDAVFSWDYDTFADGSKARRFGFHDYVETEGMFMGIFEDLRRRKIIP